VSIQTQIPTQIDKRAIQALIKAILGRKSLAIDTEDFYDELEKIVGENNVHDIYRAFIEMAETEKIPFVHYIDGFIIVIPLWLTPEQKAALKYVYELTDKYYTWLWVNDNVYRNKTNTLDALARLFLDERLRINTYDLHGPAAYAAFILAKYYGFGVSISKQDYEQYSEVVFSIPEVGKIKYIYECSYCGCDWIVKRLWDP